MSRFLRLCVMVTSLFLLAAVAGAGVVDGGRVIFGQGAAGITLGMTRAQVLSKLGAPRESHPSFMQYGNNGVFDVYLSSGRVDLIGIAGKRFCTKEQFCVGDRMREVIDRYGTRVKKFVTESDVAYLLIGSFAGKRTYTEFLVKNGVLKPSTPTLQLFIGTCAGTTVCR